jgi:mannose-6-phosphate isomerase-like protein (cupin superfamily)
MKVANISGSTARKFEGRDNYYLLMPEDGGPKNFLAGYTIVWPGCETKPAHSHSRVEEMYYVTGGRGELIIDGEGKMVSAGDLIYIPFGSTHLARNPSTAPFEYLWVISPPELPDFVKEMLKKT